MLRAARLAGGITDAMPAGAMHAQGNFVVLRLLEVAEPMDCMPLAGALLPHALQITGERNSHLHGLEIMLKLIFKIVRTHPLQCPPDCRDLPLLKVLRLHGRATCSHAALTV